MAWIGEKRRMPHGWEGQCYCYVPNDVHPASLVRSGETSVTGNRSGSTRQQMTLGPVAQTVSNVTPGVTYRLIVWGRIWSGYKADLSASKDVLPTYMWVCINHFKESPNAQENTICTDRVSPFDVWHQFVLDAVAIGSKIEVLLYASYEVRPLPPGHEGTYAVWDDALLTVAPAAATPTPTLTPLPARPAPVAFNGVALRDAMEAIRSTLQQMGGMLDRGGGTCEEYMGWYWSLVSSPTYADLPAEWQWVYGEYIGAVEHGIEEQREIKELCDAGGGRLGQLTFGSARMAIDVAIARLGPAIDKANELLGQ